MNSYGFSALGSHKVKVQVSAGLGSYLEAKEKNSLPNHLGWWQNAVPWGCRSRVLVFFVDCSLSLEISYIPFTWPLPSISKAMEDGVFLMLRLLAFLFCQISLLFSPGFSSATGLKKYCTFRGSYDYIWLTCLCSFFKKNPAMPYYAVIRVTAHRIYRLQGELQGDGGLQCHSKKFCMPQGE